MSQPRMFIQSKTHTENVRKVQETGNAANDTRHNHKENDAAVVQMLCTNAKHTRIQVTDGK